MNIDNIIQMVTAHGSSIICCSPNAATTLISTDNIEDKEWHLTEYKGTPVVILPRRTDDSTAIYVLPTSGERLLKVFFED